MGYRSPASVNAGLRRAAICRGPRAGFDHRPECRIITVVRSSADREGLNMRLIVASLAAAMLLAAPVSAQTLDLSTIKCKDFLQSGKDNIAVIITWLDGYYKEKDDPPVIDLGNFSKNSAKLAKYCADNPDNGLITAADKSLGK
jgi:acid stress chaperone HdeB